MTTRITRALLLSTLLVAVALTGCGDDGAVHSPFDPEQPDDSTKESPASPEPTPVAASVTVTVRQTISTEPCTFPGNRVTPFVRTRSGITRGTSALTNAGGWSACGEVPDDPNANFTWVVNGDGFGWIATVPVRVIVLWSGPIGTVVQYSEGVFSDAGLSGPVDPDTGEALEVDAISLVHAYALDVVPAVVASGGRTISWALRSQVTPTGWDLRPGERGISRAVVDVERTEDSSAPPHVGGTITITNPTPLPATITYLYLSLGGGQSAIPTLPGPMPYVVEPGASVVAAFDRGLPSTDPRTATLVVSTSGDVRASNQSIPIVFDPGPEAVSLVTSDGQDFGPFETSTQVTLERAFAASEVSAARADMDWVFALDGAPANAAHAVTVRVFPPESGATVDARTTRAWQWSIDVTAGDVLPSDEPVLPLRVRVNSTPDALVDNAIVGTAQFANPHPTRSLDLGDVRVDVDGQSFLVAEDVVVAPASTASVPVDLTVMGTPGSVTVHAEYMAQDVSWDGSILASAAVPIEGPADVDASANVLDASARVADTLVGALGVAQASVEGTVFDVSVPLGSFPCGPVEIAGRVMLLTDDRLLEVNEDYAFAVAVPCEGDACTRSAWYWSRHPEDPAWSGLENGPDTALFDSKFTWSSVFDKRLRGGLWKILGQQYVAVHLNGVAGADLSVVADDLAEAEAWLASHDPWRARGRDVLQAARLTWRLRLFNLGKVGPGSCTD